MLWVLAVTGIISVLVLSRVDDWSRDFSTNVAMTGESGPLKPLRLTQGVERTVEQLREAVARNSHWQWVDNTATSQGTVINLVRTTTLLRFKDDIQVTIVPDEPHDGVVINAISRSRVGKGDLGQNPRNIKELFAMFVD